MSSLKVILSDLFEKLKTDRFYLDSIVLIVFSLLGNFFAFIVNIIYTRTLPEGQYGAVMSINAMINILGTMAMGFRMFNVKETSEFIIKGKIDKSVNFTFKFSIVTFIVLVVLSVSFMPLYGMIANFIKVDSLFVILIAIQIVIFTYLSSITSSLLQSMKLFFALSLVSFSYPFLRFIITYPFIRLWDGYIGATASMLVGIVFSFYLTSLYLISKSSKLEYKNDNNEVEEKVKLSDFIPLLPIVFINVFYSVLNYTDVMFARRYFTESQSDIFSVASTIAKANLFVIIPISYIVLPRMIEDFHKKGYKTSVKALFKGIFLGFLASAIFIAFLLLFGEYVLKIFGERYLEASSILIPFTIAFVPMGLSFLLVNYSVTFKNWYFLLVVFVADLLLVLGFVFFHETFTDMILVYGFVGTIMLVSMILLVLFSKEPKEVESPENNI